MCVPSIVVKAIGNLSPLFALQLLALSVIATSEGRYQEAAQGAAACCAFFVLWATTVRRRWAPRELAPTVCLRSNVCARNATPFTSGCADVSRQAARSSGSV